MVLEFTVLLIVTDLPILLLLAEIDRLKVYHNNLNNKFRHTQSSFTADVIRTYHHLLSLRSPVNQCLFIETELHGMRKRFGHPHANKLFNFLKGSELEKVNRKILQTMKYISQKCMQFQQYALAPRRFKFNLKVNKYFNYTVVADIFYVDRNAVVQVVD